MMLAALHFHWAAGIDILRNSVRSTHCASMYSPEKIVACLALRMLGSYTLDSSSQ